MVIVIFMNIKWEKNGSYKADKLKKKTILDVLFKNMQIIDL